MEDTTSPSTKRTVKRFDPLQLGKMLGIVYAGMSLLAIPFFLLVMMMGPAHGNGPFAGVFGSILVVCLPIFYGIFGFIAGLIGACIYNIAAKIVGGIQVEVEAE
jgi:hypothetical protein